MSVDKKRPAGTWLPPSSRLELLQHLTTAIPQTLYLRDGELVLYRVQNYASAWNRVTATAVERGYISEIVPVPRLTVKGEKGTPRPTFSNEEVAQLLAYVEPWQQQGRLSIEREMWPLLSDYVEFSLLT